MKKTDLINMIADARAIRFNKDFDILVKALSTMNTRELLFIARREGLVDVSNEEIDNVTRKLRIS